MLPKQPRPSYAGLTRVSILFARVFRRGWIAGSSPAMTESGCRFREDDGGVWRGGGVYDAVTTTASPSGASTTFKPQACAKSRV